MLQFRELNEQVQQTWQNMEEQGFLKSSDGKDPWGWEGISYPVSNHLKHGKSGRCSCPMNRKLMRVETLRRPRFKSNRILKKG
jgi:hypothetical protein